MTNTQINGSTPVLNVIKRVEAIDLFKFFVLFFMIQGHLFRAYLLPSYFDTVWFEKHEIFHGIVAPSFLFASGFSAFLSYFNKRDQFQTFGKPIIKRIKRAFFVILLGYWLHLPFFSLKKTFNAVAAGRAKDFLNVDVLQCIGAGLILFYLIAVALKKIKPVIIASSVAMLLFFSLPTLTEKIQIWYIIDPYYNHTLSFFSLFPWAGFIFLGVVCAYFYTKYKPELYFKALLLLGLVFIPWHLLVDIKVFYKSELTAHGLLNKTGGVFVLLFIANWISTKFKGRIISIMKRASKESLFVYVFHLLVIFNFLSFRELQHVFNGALTLHQAFLGLLVVLPLVFGLSLVYSYVKEKHHRAWQIGFYFVWTAFLIIFIVKPY